MELIHGCIRAARSKSESLFTKRDIGSGHNASFASRRWTDCPHEFGPVFMRYTRFPAEGTSCSLLPLLYAALCCEEEYTFLHGFTGQSCPSVGI